MHAARSDLYAETPSRPSLFQRSVLWLTLSALIAQPVTVSAQVIAASAGAYKPQVEAAANGVPLIQITAPSAAGVSRNQYQQYNVSPQGVVLNNSSVVVSTQQAGFIAGNPNLAAGTARVILNEVTSSLPSSLRGYTEVGGAKAEVIIANPNGITCDGCGFINTSRGVLTTGTPVFGAGGSLDAFRVSGGQVTIQGAGLNANNVDQIDLIARAVQVNAGLWGQNLNVVTGANQVAYADLATQAIAGSGAAPAVAIDVALLGGMYAGKIRLVGTEAGVGVRSLGSLAALAGDLSISSAGYLSLSGNTSSAANIDLSGQSVINSGTLFGQGNVAVTASAGLTNSGTLVAGGNLSLQAATISANGLLASGLQSDGTFGASGDLAITATGAATLQGQTLAAGKMNVSAASIDLRNSLTQAGQDVTLSATQDDLNNTGGQLVAAGALVVQAQGNVLNAAQGGSGGVIRAGTLTLSGSALDNRGGKLTQSGSAATVLSFSGAVDNTSGTIASNGTDLTFRSAQLSNAGGQLLHGGSGTLSVQTSGIENTGGTISGNGQVKLVTQNLLSSGTVSGNSGLNISASATTNSGTFSSNGALHLTGGNVTNSGSITAYNALDIIASSLTNNGTLASNEALSLTVSGNLTNNHNLTGDRVQGTIGGALSNTGLLAANNSLDLSAASIDNSGSLRSNQALTLTSAGALTNSATLSAAGLTLNAGSLGNTGSLSGDTVRLNVTGALSNGATLTGNTLLAIVTGSLTNSGALATNGDLNITATGAMTNSGTLTSRGDQRLSGASLDNPGEVLANGSLTVATVGSVDNRGTLFGNNGIGVTANDLTNSGTLASQGDLTIQLATTLTNSGSLLAGGNAAFYLSNLYNLPNATIWAGHNLIIGLDAAGHRANRVNNDRASIETQAGDITIRADQFNNLGADPSSHIVDSSVSDYLGFAWKFPVYADAIAQAPAFYNRWLVYVPDLVQYQTWLPYEQTDKRVQFRVSGTIQTLDPAFVAQPGQLHAGHDLNLDVGTGTNQYSNITAANNITLTGGSFTNTGAALLSSVNIQVTYEDGDATQSGSNGLGNWPGAHIYLPLLSSTQYLPGVLSIIGAGGSVNASGLASFTNSNGQTSNAYVSTGSGSAYTGPTAGSAGTAPGPVTTPSVSLGAGVTLSPGGRLNFSGVPTGGLFVLAPASHPNYLVETNPLFASYTGFLSSDYFLQRLSLDPNRTEKRLGDGFYEQRLVGEQITELTGRPYLYSASHEDEYRQLLDNAVRYAQTYQLTPGIALTAAQMALVTDDLVWLEDRVVGGQHVLVPQLYLGSHSKARLEATGALVIAADINLAAGTLVNSGTLDAKNSLKLTANDVTNQNGILRGGAIQVVALNDLTSTGGQIRGDTVSLAAGNDLALKATQVTAQTALSAAAGRDLTLGTLTEHYAAGGQQGQGYDETWQTSGTIAHRTSLQSNGSVSLAAGRDLTSVGARVSAVGDGELTAGRDITLVAAQEQHQSHIEQHKSGYRTHSDSVEDRSDTTLTGSVVSVGGNLSVTAGSQATPGSGSGNAPQEIPLGNLTLQGSALAAGKDLAIQTTGDLQLLAGVSQRYESIQHSEQTRKKAESLNFELEQNRLLLSTLTAGNSIDLKVGGNLAAQTATTDANGQLQADRITADGVVKGSDRQQVALTHSDDKAGTTLNGPTSKVLGDLAAQGIRSGANDSFSPQAVQTGQAAVTALINSGLLNVKNQPAVQAALDAPTPNGSALTYRDDSGKVTLTLAGQAKVQAVYSQLKLTETFDVKHFADQGTAQIVTLVAAIALTVCTGGAGAGTLGAAMATAGSTSAMMINAAVIAMASTMTGQLAGGASFDQAFEAGLKAGASSAITAGILNAPVLDNGAQGMQSINQLANVQTTGANIVGRFSADTLGQNLGGMALRGVVNASVSTAIYGGSFGDAFKSSFISDLAAVGANAVGLSTKTLSPENILGHAAVGAVAAQLKGLDALSGAIGGAGGAIVNPLLDQAIGGADGSGWGSDPQTAQQWQTATLQLGSMAVSAATAAALGKDGMTAALAAQNETVNNYLSQKRTTIPARSEQERYNEALKSGDTATLKELANISAARDEALARACADPNSTACGMAVRAANASGNKVLTDGNGRFIAVPADTPELSVPSRATNGFQDQTAQGVATLAAQELIASGAGTLFKGAGIVAGRLFGYSEAFLGEAGSVAAKGGTAAMGSVADANFAQSTIRASEIFSKDGIANYSQLAGRPINTVDDLAAALQSGAIKPSQLPVDYVVTTDGTKLILNTRTSVALDRAGIPKSDWYGTNKTGVSVPKMPGTTFDDLAADQLKNNKLPSTGTPTMPKGKN
jgi:filamentous hemagglutinin